MGKILHFSTSAKRSGPASGRRRVGRDLLAAVLLGLLIGSSGAWWAADPARAAALLDTVTLAITPPEAADASDLDPLATTALPALRQQRPKRFPPCYAAAPKAATCVVDGDTFRLEGVTIRISDIDTPETHPPRCTLEAELGDRATLRLSHLLDAGPFTLVRQGRDTDRYGRKLRIVMRNGRSLGDVLVSEGVARPWTGKRRPWCPSEPSS